MRASEPGETAIGLTWLPPSQASLVALVRDASTGAWPVVRNDPGAVMLLARHIPAGRDPIFPNSTFQDANVLEMAGRCVVAAPTRECCHPDTIIVRRISTAMAMLAERIAKHVGGLDPACAWIGGLSAPLGWQAVCAVDPDAAGDCLREVVNPEQQSEMQRRIWRFDTHEIGRRLARRWNLPPWLRAVVGYLATPAAQCVEVGADRRLFQIVQLAIALAQANGQNLGLAVGTDCEELFSSLGMSLEEVQAIGVAWRSDLATETHRPQIIERPLLPELLAIAAAKRRQDDGPFGEMLECEIDRLQQALIEQRATERERLHQLKLRAVAELAAGAGHEINNPLPVISGQSQYLLARLEEDPAQESSLRSMVRQTERIHQILNDLMQFARPPKPRRQRIDARALAADVLAAYAPQAEARGICCEALESSEPIFIYGDPVMLRTALGCLIRNAVEAAPADGWVRIQIETADEDWRFVVEDSGPGPQPIQREHLFDPFFSGRHAGRGRGLGLSTAWRFAQEHGGDVRFEPLPNHPARFVLILPRFVARFGSPEPAADEIGERISA